MKTLVLLAAGLILCSVSSLAGEFLINEEVAYGLRVTFSAPVTITHFGDVLPKVSPEGESVEFLFSGATLPAWVGHGMIWSPATARILSYQWLSSPPSATIPDVGPAVGPPTEDQAGPPTVGPAVGPEPPLVAVPETTQDEVVVGPAPDWSDVAYVRSYDQGDIGLEQVFLNGEPVSIDRARYWGLPGSEIKGLKLSYTDTGVFILLETWPPTIQGSYQYGIGFRPESSNYQMFEIGADPASGVVWAETESGLDLSAHVRLVSLDDDSLELFMEDALLPGGASVLSTGRLWTRFIVCHYLAASQNESYELEHRVDIER